MLLFLYAGSSSKETMDRDYISGDTGSGVGLLGYAVLNCIQRFVLIVWACRGVFAAEAKIHRKKRRKKKKKKEEEWISKFIYIYIYI
jgi:hypothetical protein